MNHIEPLYGCCDLNSGLLRCSKGYYLQSHFASSLPFGLFVTGSLVPPLCGYHIASNPGSRPPDELMIILQASLVQVESKYFRFPDTS